MTPANREARSGRGVLEVLLAATLFGTTGTSASFAPAGASSVAIGAARLVIGGLGLLAVVPVLGGRRDRVVALWRTPLAIFAGLMTAAYQLSFFAGVSLAGVALATLVTIGTGPILVGLLSWFALHDRPTRSWWLSTGVCIAGLLLLASEGPSQAGGDPIGLVFALASAAGYAAYTVAAKELLRRGAAPSEAMAASFGLGGLLLAPVLLLAGAGWLATPSGAAVALWLGLATTTVAYVLFGRGLRQLPPAPVATLVLAEPLVATLLGVGVLGEHLGRAGIAGAALVAAGLGLQGIASIRSRPDASPTLVTDVPA